MAFHRRTKLQWNRPLALAAFLALGACSTLSPQVFSLAPEPTGATGEARIESAIAQAEDLQGRYVKSVQDLSEVSAGGSAALIVLSALALFQGVTDPHPKDMAGAGVLGSATYAYTTTMTSRTRQGVYLAGAEALNCAIGATTPYRLPAGWSANEPADNPLSDLADQGDRMAAVLANQALELAALNVTTRDVSDERPPPATCQKAMPMVCPSASAAETEARRRERLTCEQAAAKGRERCLPAGKSISKVLPDPAIAATLTELQAAQRRVEGLARKAHQQSSQFLMLHERAGSELWGAVRKIQFDVAREVLKTEPDPKIVLAAAQSLRDTANAISSAPSVAAPVASQPDKNAGPAGQAHSDKAARSVVERTGIAPADKLNKARQAIDKARRLANRLSVATIDMRQRLQAARNSLDRCGQAIDATVLRLLPSVSEIELAPGASWTVTVTGGSGTPQGSLVTNGSSRPGVLKRNLDGSFVYTAAADADDTVAVVLRFTDGAGTQAREVNVRVVIPEGTEKAAGGGSVDIKLLNTTKLADAVGAKEKPPNDKEIAQLVETCLKDRLDLAEPDLQNLDMAQVKRIFAGACR
jgi:hypothetical protein